LIFSRPAIQFITQQLGYSKPKQKNFLNISQAQWRSRIFFGGGGGGGDFGKGVTKNVMFHNKLFNLEKSSTGLYNIHVRPIHV